MMCRALVSRPLWQVSSSSFNESGQRSKWAGLPVSCVCPISGTYSSEYAGYDLWLFAPMITIGAFIR